MKFLFFMHKLLKSVKGRCPLSAFNPQQFSVTYRQGSTPTFPFIGRRYTLTHSEQTDDLFLWIDEKFAVDQLKQKKNEGKGSLKRVFSDQIKQRLNTLSSSKGDLYQQLQQIIGANIQKAVLVKISRVKQNPSHNLLNSKRVKQNVHSLIGKEEKALNR